ncbi:MAG TPA: DMT family transporter [Anaerolineales bacterium]|nr:DMT family transporter [Anaerolineales bacterium]
MTPSNRNHLIAVLQALLVTFLWATSWVLIKIGLHAELPPITFAGIRYTLAFLCLLPLVLMHKQHAQTVRRLSKFQWVELTILGVVYYTLAQGAQFVGLALLPASTLTLLLNFSPIFIAVYSMFSIHERTSLLQWGGIFLSIAGALVYFLPLSLDGALAFGLLAAFVGVMGNSAASVLGRKINSNGRTSPLVVTTISMGVGGVLMLAIGLAAQGVGRLTIQQWGIIAWLAVVNTAFAFTLWNKSLQTLTAVESSIINSTMLPQIAILAWIFLDEPLGNRQIAGLALVASGTLIVQLWRYLPFSR